MKRLPSSLRTHFCQSLLLLLLVALIMPAPWSRAQTASTLIGLASGNVLVRFSSATPGTLISSIIISGLQSGESVVAIDFRPATGQLYGLGLTNNAGTDTGRLYLIDPGTGAATLVGPGPFSTALTNGANYGFDVNPVADRIRVVNDADQNFRLNPDTGALAAQDTPVDNPAASEEIVGAAYAQNVAGATSTTLFGIDAANNSLVRQGGVNGQPPSANGGVITTLGSRGLTVASPNIGFDIAGIDGTAFASLQNAGNNLFGLYTINLSTGQATLVGTISNGALQLRGLAVVPIRQTYLPLVVK